MKTAYSKIEDMERRKLVEITDTKKARTGLMSPRYSITFIGLLEVLANTESSKDIQDVIQKNNNKNFHELFNSETLKSTLKIDDNEIIWNLYGLASKQTVFQKYFFTDGHPAFYNLSFPLYFIKGSKNRFEDAFSLNFLMVLNMVKPSLSIIPDPEIYKLFSDIVNKMEVSLNNLQKFIVSFKPEEFE